MPITTQFTDNAGDIHVGPGYLFVNPLPPLFGMRPLIGAGAPPTLSDPTSPSAWAGTTAYAVGHYVLDANNNVQVVQAIVGTGTSAASAPTWSAIVGATTVDNPGGNQITWYNAGPSWIWAATTVVLRDQVVRDSNGNLQRCIVPGTTGGSAPTWATNAGYVTTDGTGTTAAQWMCLGPTLAMGANEGAIEFDMSPKMLDIESDHDTAPVDFATTGESGMISGTLMELSVLKVAAMTPNGVYSTGTDPNFPPNAQNYAQLTFGGQTRVPRPAIFVCSYRKEYGYSLNTASQPFKYFGAMLYAAGSEGGGKFPFSLKKNSTYKVSAKGSVTAWRPVGDRIGQFWKQL